MSISIELVLQEGETLESALRRFKRKVQQENLILESLTKKIKKNALPLKSAEKRIVKEALARKRNRKRALLDDAIQQVKALSPKRQDAIAEAILADLRQDVDPSTIRFQELIEAKYTRGLTPAESLEMGYLEAAFRDSDKAFYGPIIERVKAKKSAAGRRRGSS